MPTFGSPISRTANHVRLQIKSLGIAAALGLLLWAPTIKAANATWTGGSGTLNWVDGVNWGGTAPGSTSGTTNGDTATFTTATAGSTVAIDEGRNIKSISVTGTTGGIYTLGSAGAELGPALHLSSGGTMSIGTNVTTITTVNAPLILEGATATTAGVYTFTNTGTSTSRLNIAGGVSGGTTTSTVTLTLAGTVGDRGGPASANTISGIISNGGAASLAVTLAASGTNSGAWNLTGLNTYTGTTTVGNGSLYFNSIADSGVASALGRGNTIALNPNGFMFYTGSTNASTNRTITSNGGSLYNNTNGTVLTLNGNVVINTNAAITLRGGGNMVINGVISGTGASVNRTETSTLTLTNINTFTGGVNIAAGTISTNTIANGGTDSGIGAGTAISFGQNQSSPAVGKLQFTGATGGSSNRSMTLVNGASSPATGSGGILENTVAGQTLTMSGTVKANSATSASYLELAGAGNGVLSGVIANETAPDLGDITINMSLTKSGTGTWTVSGTNNFSGTTRITGGTLKLRNGLALGTVTGGTVVSSGAALVLENNISVGDEALSLAGNGGTAGQSGALVNASGNNSYGGLVTLAAATTISSDAGNLHLTNAGNITGSGFALTLNGNGNGRLDSGITTGTGALNKNGAGIWTLGGNSIYTGATTVNAGALNVLGTLGNTAVSVKAGATLGGKGSIAGAVTVSDGATLAAGDLLNPTLGGTLNFGSNLILENSAQLHFDLGSAGTDNIVVAGNLTLDGVLNISAGAGLVSNNYNLISYTGTLTDRGLQLGSLSSGYKYVLSTANPGEVSLTVDQAGLQFWDGNNISSDGVVSGGSGEWGDSLGLTNWTDPFGSSNNSWVNTTAVFAGTAGIVTVKNEMFVEGLQFGTNGYQLVANGGSINLAAAVSEIRTDSGVTTTISAPIVGTGTLTKTNNGILILTGANSYSGGTSLNQGTLVVGANNTLPTTGAVTVGLGALAGHLDLSNFSQTVASLQLATNSKVNSNLVTIGAGQTLTVNGAGGFKIGVANSSGITSVATITGAGSLVVNNANANFEVGLETASPDTNPANSTTLNLGNLATLSATVREFRVGWGLNNGVTLNLSNTSNTINATSVQIGHSNGWNSQPVNVVLGTGTNVIQTDNLNIGFSKGTATVKFASGTSGSPGTVEIRGKTGAAANITIGNSNGTITGFTTTGTLDLRGHLANVTADQLIIGKRDASGTGGASGTLYFDGGTFVARTVNVGLRTGTGDSAAAVGVLNISGGTFTVSADGSFKLATDTHTAGTSSATGTLNLTGGTLISNVNLEDGGGTSTSQINLSGGTLDMTGHDIGTAAASIDTLTLASGVLQNVNQINNGAAVTKTSAGLLLLAGNNNFSGGVTVSAGNLQVGSNGSGTSGTGAINTAAGTTLSGSGTVRGATTINGTLRPGDNGGTGVGRLTFTDTSASSLVLSGGTTKASPRAVFTLAGATGNAMAFNDDVSNGINTAALLTGAPGSGTHDSIQVDGTLSLSSGSTIVVEFASGYKAGYGDVFNLLDWQNITLGSFDATNTPNSTDLNLDLAVLDSGHFWDTSQFLTHGIIFVVPEPGRAMLLLTGMIALSLRRRRNAVVSI